jgi:oxaloacetate decarboxylase alpha subunit
MLTAGPARRHYNPDLAGVLALLRGLASRLAPAQLAVSKPGFRLELRDRGESHAPGA